MANNVEEHILRLRDEFNSKLDKAIKNTDRLRQTVRKSQNGFAGLQKFAVRAFAAIGVAKVIKDIGSLGIEMEQTRVAFTTFLGDAEKANQTIADLQQFANVTPFDTQSVIKAGKTLLAFGIQAEELPETMKFLGDISAGTGKDLSELGVIFGQIRGAGRLMGQDLLQLINAGFNPLQEISERTGESMQSLKKRMSEGNVTFDEVRDSFKAATSEGGKFFNLMEKQSKTVGGRISTLIGILQNMGVAIGEAALPVIGAVVDGLQTLVKFIQDNKTAFILMFRPLLRIVDPILEKFREIRSQIFGTADAAMILEGVFNVIGNVIDFLTPVFDLFGSVIAELIQQIVNVALAVKQFIDKSQTAQKVIGGIFGAFKALVALIKNVVLKALKSVGGLLVGIFTGDVEKIKESLLGIGDVLLEGNAINVGLEAAKAFREGFDKGLGDPQDFFFEGRLIDTVREANKKVTPPGAPPPGSTLPAGGTTGRAAGISTVTSGTPKQININIESLIETLNVNQGDSAMNFAEIERKVTEVIIKGVNDAQLAIK